MLEQDEEVLVWMPHTHVRGSCFKYEAIYPDGKKEVLLDVPHYDFNWQNSYLLASPSCCPRERPCAARRVTTTRRRTWPIPIPPRPFDGANRPGRK